MPLFEVERPGGRVTTRTGTGFPDHRTRLAVQPSAGVAQIKDYDAAIDQRRTGEAPRRHLRSEFLRQRALPDQLARRGDERADIALAGEREDSAALHGGRGVGTALIDIL